MKQYLFIFFIFVTSCSTTSYMNTVDKVEIPKFMGDWYVLAGRFTFLEKNVHNAIERYTWNEKENRIDVGFTYNKGSLQGEVKSLPQKAWIYNSKTNAHWKVSPLWPFKFDYLVIDLADDYSWTAIGVPSQNYLWIMARSPKNPELTVKEAIERLQAKGYNTENIVIVPHN
jgi:apolipoprotein D and lipocalin family protein